MQTNLTNNCRKFYNETLELFLKKWQFMSYYVFRHTMYTVMDFDITE